MNNFQRLKQLTDSLAVAEESQRLANTRLQTALAAAGAGVWDWEVESNTLRWDDRMVELFGYHSKRFKRDEAGWNLCTYHHFIDRVHPEDREPVQSQVDACLKDGIPYRTSYRVIHPDGEIVKIIHAAGDIHVDKDGTLERLVGVCFDIAHLKHCDC